MFCAISGEVAKEPVVSSISGHMVGAACHIRLAAIAHRSTFAVRDAAHKCAATHGRSFLTATRARSFERALIEKALQASGNVCPITKQPLSPDNLIRVVASGTDGAAPRSVEGASPQSLVHLLHSEIDALALANHKLKSDLDTVRKELATALYQQDAAARVVARLTAERDAAREALVTAKASGGGGGGGGAAAPMETDSAAAASSAAVPADVSASLHATQQALSSRRKQERKERKKSGGAERQYAAKAEHACGKKRRRGDGVSHGAAALARGALVAASGTGACYVAASGDGELTAAAWEKAKKSQAACELVSSHGALHVGAGGGQVWRYAASEEALSREWSVASPVGDDVVAVCAHPGEKHVCVFGRDGRVALLSAADGAVAASGSLGATVTVAGVHPDGLLAVAGTESGQLAVYDICANKVVATLAGGGSAAVSALGFSANGYTVLSAAGKDLTVWDLRKQAAASTRQMAGDVTSVAVSQCDKQFVAVAGNEVVVGKVKAANEEATSLGNADVAVLNNDDEIIVMDGSKFKLYA